MAEIDLRNGIKSFTIEAAGDVVRTNDTIRTGKDTSIAIKTLGKYESTGSKTIQGGERIMKDKWWESTPIQIIFTLSAIVTILTFIILIF
jgi:hypothetical protein